MSSEPQGPKGPANVKRAAVLEEDTPEAAQIRALAQLPPDVALIRLEHETMTSLAKASPRDLKQIAVYLIDQLTQFPEFAKIARYRKPVGKDPETRKMKYAVGLSVRSAEAIAEAYGRCAVRTGVDLLGPDHAKVTVIFMDYQGGRSWKVERIVPKQYRSKTGGMVRHNEDRFFEIVVPAASSRAIRECIMRCVPPALKAEFEAAAIRAVEGLLTPERISLIVKSFAEKYGVDSEELEKFLGKPTAKWTQKDRETLMMTWASLETDETTVAEVFRGESPAGEGQEGGPVTADDLASEIEGAGASTGGSTQPSAQEESDPGRRTRPVDSNEAAPRGRGGLFPGPVPGQRPSVDPPVSPRGRRQPSR